MIIYSCIQANAAFKRIQAYLEKDEINTGAVTKNNNSRKFYISIKNACLNQPFPLVNAFLQKFLANKRKVVSETAK